jgi:hypothetical protein
VWATRPSNFALGRATIDDAYWVAIRVFGSGKLAPTGRWLRNRGGEDEEAEDKAARQQPGLVLYHGPAAYLYRCPPSQAEGIVVVWQCLCVLDLKFEDYRPATGKASPLLNTLKGVKAAHRWQYGTRSYVPG